MNEREAVEFVKQVAVGVCVMLVVKWLTEDGPAPPPQTAQRRPVPVLPKTK